MTLVLIVVKMDPRTNISDNDSFVSNDNDNDDENDLSVDLDNLFGKDGTGDELYEVLNKDPEWISENFQDIHVRQFSEQTGPDLPDSFDTSTATPLDYFQLFFDDHVFETIVQNTNKYEKYSVNKKRIVKPNYTEKFWEPTTQLEFKAYLGLCIMFGILNQPRYRGYWSSDPFYGNEAVKTVMTLRRYQKLSEYFHVSDREGLRRTLGIRNMINLGKFVGY